MVHSSYHTFISFLQWNPIRRFIIVTYKYLVTNLVYKYYWYKWLFYYYDYIHYFFNVLGCGRRFQVRFWFGPTWKINSLNWSGVLERNSIALVLWQYRKCSSLRLGDGLSHFYCELHEKTELDDPFHENSQTGWVLPRVSRYSTRVSTFFDNHVRSQFLI